MATTASAQLMAGHPLLFAQAFPSATSGANTERVVGPGTEYVASYGWTVDASDTQLRVTFTKNQLWTTPEGTTPFNGMRITDGAHVVDAFKAVTMDAASTLPGFDASSIHFSDDQILVNFIGLTSQIGDTVVLTVSSVPEPAQAWLLLAGLAGLAPMARRRRG